MRTYVYVCSPFSNPDMMQHCENISYAKRCARNCIQRREHPIVVHLHYTQFLEDSDPDERELGMAFGHQLLELGIFAKVVAYTDRGISEGMKKEIEFATWLGIEVEYRSLVG